MYLSSILSSIENTIKEQNPGSKMYPKALNNQYGIDIPLVGNVIISLLNVKRKNIPLHILSGNNISSLLPFMSNRMTN